MSGQAGSWAQNRDQTELRQHAPRSTKLSGQPINEGNLLFPLDKYLSWMSTHADRRVAQSIAACRLPGAGDEDRRGHDSGTGCADEVAARDVGHGASPVR